MNMNGTGSGLEYQPADRGSDVGVLLLNLGGPDSLQAVRPFLYNLFSDREIIRLGPAFLQKPIACLIAFFRSKKTEEAYSLIGGRSPIREITMAQAAALEKALNSESPGGDRPYYRYRVSVGMRYWQPFIRDTLRRMHSEGVRRIIALGAYPQYSVATSGSSVRKLLWTLQEDYGQEISAYLNSDLQSAFTVHGRPFTVVNVPSWHTHPLYIGALAETIEKGMDSFREELESIGAEPAVHVLFSAHSLPVKFIEEGDPYDLQTRETIAEVVKGRGYPWDLSYQSKSGPVKWLEPSTDSMIEDLARRGVRNILVVPVSFVSDHIETLYEIDILYRGMAGKLGMRLRRTEALNTHPLFIAALKDLVLSAAVEGAWQE